MSGLAHEVKTEQDTVDLLYRRLDELRQQARSRLSRVRRAAPSGSPQNRSERDAFASLYADRLAQLEAVEDRLCFGRLDLEDGTIRHIGRIGLTDAEHTSLLTDWRAPAAQAFYRATAAVNYNVVRRRHLVTKGREVLSLEDEVLDLASLAADTSGTFGHLSGEGALFAAMAAGRTGQMGDIVATIQAEQDAIIRAPLEGSLVVQGGPGTGKTAVALHRAAYLLYAHRRLLERSGVLLIGPSSSFLRYIDQVLPSLGETGVVSTTIGGLLPGVQANSDDASAVAILKGDASFAKVIERAVRARQRVPAQNVPVSLDGTALTIRRRDVESAIHRARRTGRPHNLARVAFVKDMLNRLTDQYSSQLDFPLAPEDRGDVVEDLRTTREVRVALNLAWMPLTAEGLVTDLFAKPHRLAEAAPHLSVTELATLKRPVGSPWTISDVPLLDEAAELLGEDDQAARAQELAEAGQRTADLEYARQVLDTSSASSMVSAEMLADRFSSSGSSLTTAERAAADRAWTYGHIVVDEAQELSAMAWRMLLRRCPTQSLTIVGDVAQTSNEAGTHNWEASLRPILRTWRVEELTINYRTPAVIAQGAQAVAIDLGLPVSPMTSARDVENAITITHSDSGAVEQTAVEVVSSVSAQIVRGDGTGRIAVIAALEDLPALRARFTASDLAPLLQPKVGHSQLDAPINILDARASKGLEFDVVVLVEPLGLLRPADLYVAMTRPTQALHLVHSGGVPEGLLTHTPGR